jgi:hypothetical protein
MTELLRRRPTVTNDARRIRNYARALVNGNAEPPLVIFADDEGTWAVSRAAFARELVRARQLEGIARAKLEGRYNGRRPVIDPAKVRELWDQGLGATEIAGALHIGRSSVYRVLA